MANNEKNVTAPETPVIDEKEFDAAIAEARANDVSVITIKLKKPVKYNNKEYTELSFDFDKLTGMDGLAIEEELQMLGKAVIVPTLSGPYLVRMAARACTEKIGADIFNYLSLKDFNRIRDTARSFLLRSESN